eukprot:7048-Pelagococcus_subviridis.AAC.5
MEANFSELAQHLRAWQARVLLRSREEGFVHLRQRQARLQVVDVRQEHARELLVRVERRHARGVERVVFLRLPRERRLRRVERLLRGSRVLASVFELFLERAPRLASGRDDGEEADASVGRGIRRRRAKTFRRRHDGTATCARAGGGDGVERPARLKKRTLKVVQISRIKSQLCAVIVVVMISS